MGITKVRPFCHPAGESTRARQQDSDAASRLVADLAELVQAIFTALPPSRPWQRRLLQQLAEADRLVQVLRLIVAMGRAQAEVAEAAGQLAAVLRAADRYVAVGRADLVIKSAVRLATDLAQCIVVALSGEGPRAPEESVQLRPMRPSRG
ncbi:hypothetical protein [Roseateles sp.]|uniref:hypothetical protein n=1 Tax=Roseateles sp. TaxID=1971397 RepID=UPI0025EABFEF|nr:hypothetical protein [Roseateles sp.]MBV8035795.1 hypothetical protein [Roseateles sp.]